jgi:hypothetical protein
LAAGSACAQYVISAHSGVVQYVEGSAYLNDHAVDPKFGQFPDIKENQEFRTEEGRAEILLNPGVFLRLGENSSIRMLSNRLPDTRVEVLRGSAMVECDDVPKGNSIELVYKGNSMLLDKQGLYRVDTQPARFRVYNGEAIVKGEAGQLTLKSGKETALEAILTAENFDRKDDDELYRWSDRRAGYVAQANVASASTASSAYSSGYGYSGYGFGLGGYGLGYGFLGGWALNPDFGMYTWMPYSGFGYSPFGYTYFSPYTIAYAPYYGGNVSRTNRTSNTALHPGWPARSSSRGGLTAGSSGAAAGSGHFSGGHFGGISSGGGHSSGHGR